MDIPLTESRKSLSVRLFAGLALTLIALSVYAAYTTNQIGMLRRLQTDIIERNRKDSLLLVRIQNDLNTLGIAMRDMLDNKEAYPLTAWRSQFQRVRTDLEDAVSREAAFAPAGRTADQGRYLVSSMTQFWDALDRTFALAARDEPEARTQIRLSLQARQAALSTAVSRLLVLNNETEEQAAVRAQQIHSQVERNLYIFLGAMLLAIGAISAYVISYNRRVFDRVATLSERRSELAQQLISMQESTFRSISRELHDEFGQILTAIGAMLQRLHRRSGPETAAFKDDLREIHEIVQTTLEKVRSLSQALHPVMLEETGLESTLDTYIPVFEKRSGIAIRFTKSGTPCAVNGEPSIHIYRVLQEALNNVARHSGSNEAEVRLDFGPRSLTLEVEDHGKGFHRDRNRDGLGLVSMRERAEMVNGRVEFLSGPKGGAMIRLTVPLNAEHSHA